jgi:hypothetical protein
MKEKLTPLRSADFEAGAAHERQTIIDYFRSLAWIHAEFDDLADALEDGEHVAAVKRQN